MMSRFLITGGAGFIGSAVVRHIIRETPHQVLVVDKLTYAGNLDSLMPVSNDPRYAFVRADVADAPKVRELFESYQPDAVMHLAAESHVDRSIDGPGEFIQTNVVGTFTLLQAALGFWRALPDTKKEGFRFHHVSTDEVFGSLGDAGLFCESTAYDPRSPYSASKAASDHLVRAWHHTYGLPVVVTNCANNYGPYHFPEKLIPLIIINALEGLKLPVYGQGANVRDWLFVDEQPVAHIGALAIDRQLQALERIDDDQRDQLFGKMIRAVIVRAVGHDHRQAVSVMPGADQMIGRGLRGGVGRTRIVGGRLAEQAFLAERAEDFIGRD